MYFDACLCNTTFTGAGILDHHERVFTSSGQRLFFFLLSSLESQFVQLDQPYLKSEKEAQKTVEIYITLKRFLHPFCCLVWLMSTFSS